MCVFSREPPDICSHDNEFARRLIPRNLEQQKTIEQISVRRRFTYLPLITQSVRGKVRCKSRLGTGVSQLSIKMLHIWIHSGRRRKWFGCEGRTLYAPRINVYHTIQLMETRASVHSRTDLVGGDTMRASERRNRRFEGLALQLQNIDSLEWTRAQTVWATAKNSTASIFSPHGERRCRWQKSDSRDSFFLHNSRGKVSFCKQTWTNCKPLMACNWVHLCP